MGMFDVAAPVFARLAVRLSLQDAESIAGLLRSHVSPGGRLLDVGGGTGQLAATLAEELQADTIVLDPSARMLSYVPAHPLISKVQGNAEALPFAEASFDALIVSDAMHHFRGRDAAAREFFRVLKPKGALLVLELDPALAAVKAIRALERLLGEPGGFMTPRELSAFFALRGFAGDWHRVRGIGYRFMATRDHASVRRRRGLAR